MKVCQDILILMFLNCASIAVSNNILWEQELIYDPNSNTGPLAVCSDEKENGIYIITKTVSKGRFLINEGDARLWKLSADGNIVQSTVLTDEDKNVIKTNALPIGDACVMGCDTRGNLLTAGVLGEQRKGKSLAVILNEDKSMCDPNIILGSQIGKLNIKTMVSFEDDSFAIIGARRHNGSFMRIDNRGELIHEVPYDMGQNEKCTGAVPLKPDKQNLAIVGLSFSKSDIKSERNIAENFIVIYDPNDTLLHEDYFTGVLPGITFPRACCLGNSHIIIVYYNKLEQESGLWARCYNQKLEILWEKKIVSEDNPSFLFDVVSYRSGFRVATITPVKGLKFYSYNEKGERIGFAEYKGQVSISGFNFLRVRDRTIAVFEENELGRLKDITIKTKAIALE